MPDATLMSRISSQSDPTALTTDNLRREVNHLKELVFTRLDAMDKAMIIFNENITKVPTDVDKQVGHLNSLTNEKFDTIREHFEVQETHFKILEEKFSGVNIQFSGRDTALAAALQAAKEAVGEQTKTSKESIDKSEKNMLEAIKQQRDLLQTNYASLNDKITLFDKTTRDLLQAYDLRLTRFEGKNLGNVEARTDQRADATEHRGANSATLAYVMAAVVIVNVLIGFAIKFI